MAFSAKYQVKSTAACLKSLLLSKRTLFKILLTFVVLKIIYESYNTYYLIDDHEELFDSLKQRNYKAVQLLTERFTFKGWNFKHPLGEAVFSSCPEKRCYAFKASIWQTPLEMSDAVVVHVPNLWALPDRSKYKRRREQLWLFYTLESPHRSFCSSHYGPNDLNDWFNLTATYKSDSHIISDYQPFRTWNDSFSDREYVDAFEKFKSNHATPGAALDAMFAKKFSQFFDPHKNKIAEKRRWYKDELVIRSPVVWFVSHCYTSGKREDYIKELEKYISVDIFGSCAGLFPNNQPHPCGIEHAENATYCMIALLDSYKFYLSFENSLCNEYITEKYWKLYRASNLFGANILPVVRGAKGFQYKRNAPPNSFINADDFDSPKSLGEYLAYLNNNDTAYMEYFKWKFDYVDGFESHLSNESSSSRIDEYRAPDILHDPFCVLCSLLHNKTYMENGASNWQHKISSWFDDSDCWSPDEDSGPIYWFRKYIGICF